MNFRAHIDSDELNHLYFDDGLTIEEIAARFGCSPTTIRRRMDDLGIDARPRGPYVERDRSPEWSPELAYVVGLITSDGNRSSDGRHLQSTSKDYDLLETARACLGISNSITPSSGSGFSSHTHFRLQWGNRVFYDWLISIGLMPAKSLRLGPLAIPDEHFADFVRGCVDGDGTIVTYTDYYNTSKSDDYIYERLFVALVSASHPFLEWMQGTLNRLLSISGGISKNHPACWTLKYMKKDSLRLLKWIYYSPDVPCLARKRDKAMPFITGYGSP
ncbi:MAG TPA: hypothetical protein VJ020_13400, partial [Anaerolineales bacterium]|nr:hypothetical protein [Anaerolineales bacterium]